MKLALLCIGVHALFGFAAMVVAMSERHRVHVAQAAAVFGFDVFCFFAVLGSWP